MNKRDQARELNREYTRQRNIEMVACAAKRKAEKALAEIARTIKPDPECNCAMTTWMDGKKMCVWCFTADIKDDLY